jgi:hypothetical protein
MVTYASTADAYNSVGASTTGNGPAGAPGTPGYGFDGNGDTYDYNHLPAGGTEIHHGSLFVWPTIAAGQPDNIQADGRVIATHTSGTRIGILGSIAGATTGFNLVVYYTDGTASYAHFTLPPWANSSKPTTADLIVDTIGNYGRNGFNANGVHYDIFYAQAATAAGKTVKAIAVPFIPTVHIFDAVPA